MRFLFGLFILFISFPALAQDSYDRVMEAGEIRCGYGVSDPWILYDFEAGKPKGIMVDLAERVAELLDVRLQWGEETGWANIPASLKNGRIDMSCTPLWRNPLQGKMISYTDALFYNPMFAFTREGETAFQSREDINRKETKISIQDGAFGQNIAKFFPNATIVSIPQSAPWSDNFLNVSTGKADIVFADNLSIQNYNTQNDGKLVQVDLGEPLAVYGNSFAVSIDDPRMHHMIQTTVKHMIENGDVERITAEFRAKYPGVIRLPAKGYE